jgi:glycosyltransferase involved in cell wall biosynthesis
MLFAIVPAYNEEKNIGSVVRNLFGRVDRVIVVDDNSCDNTYASAKEAGAIVLRHKINRGQGATLQTGHEYALKNGADYVLHFDGDGQFDVEDILPAITKMKNEQADILFGSRFLESKNNIPFFKKNIILPLARLFHFIFFGLNLSDAHNGFRILNRNALKNIIIEQDRMAHATEIIAKTKQIGLKYIEFPVKVVYREYGQGIGGAFAILKDLFFGGFFKK